MKRLAIGALVLVGCGIQIARDFSKVTPQEVVYEDRCGLQEYFDVQAMGRLEPPRLARTREIERADKAVGGGAAFVFETPVQLEAARRVLKENWGNLPASLGTASSIEIEVQWAEKAAVRRVVTDQSATMTVNGGQTLYLPYHICLSELLYGAPLYRTRRDLLGLPPLPTQDGGVADARAGN